MEGQNHSKAAGDHHLEMIANRKNSGMYRSLAVREGLIDFCSNDYLGFARSEDIRELLIAEIQRSPECGWLGSSGSRLISGSSYALERLEAYIADYHRASQSLIFPTGYSANLGLLSCVGSRTDSILYDEMCHASIRDGVRLSYAKGIKFRHNDGEDLRRKLRSAKGTVYVVVEAVYSMDGDECSLPEILSICEEREARIIIDEAHSVGVYGDGGRGVACAHDLESHIFARVLTFGKALGCQGAAVLGSEGLRSYLINFCRPFIYTTAPSPLLISGLECVYRHLSQSEDERKKLWALVACVKEEFRELQSGRRACNGPIQSIIIPGNRRVRDIARVLEERGFDVRPILSPTVPKGSERLRVCLHSFNSEGDVRELLSIIKSEGVDS